MSDLEVSMLNDFSDDVGKLSIASRPYLLTVKGAEVQSFLEKFGRFKKKFKDCDIFDFVDPKLTGSLISVGFVEKDDEASLLKYLEGLVTTQLPLLNIQYSFNYEKIKYSLEDELNVRVVEFLKSVTEILKDLGWFARIENKHRIRRELLEHISGMLAPAELKISMELWIQGEDDTPTIKAYARELLKRAREKEIDFLAGPKALLGRKEMKKEVLDVSGKRIENVEVPDQDNEKTREKFKRDVADLECLGCKKKGHFVRDCTEISKTEKDSILEKLKNRRSPVTRSQAE